MNDKLCNSCKIRKPISDFYKSVVNKDGHCGICKPCHNAKTANYRNKQKNLLRYDEVPQYKKFWLQENKLKTTAHRAVSYAIKTGRLVRLPCERCGTTIDVVGHHEDYSKPLEVMWLCKQHHAERHIELDAMAEKPKTDMVNHPPHYTHGGIETITYIRAKLSPEEYVGYLRGNIMKYTSRIGLKGESAQDAGKIEWYSKELNRFLTEG